MTTNREIAGLRIICIRHWFDRTYGNSYSSCRAIFVNPDGDDIVVLVPFFYGHGVHQAVKQAATVLGQGDRFIVPQYVEECNVTRRKDLHGNGRARPGWATSPDNPNNRD